MGITRYPTHDQTATRKVGVVATNPGVEVKHKGRETATATTQTKQEQERPVTETETGLLRKPKSLREKQQR